MYRSMQILVAACVLAHVSGCGPDVHKITDGDENGTQVTYHEYQDRTGLWHLHGLKTVVYSNGHKTVTRYKRGMQKGNAVTYDPNGQKAAEMGYGDWNAILSGKYTAWYTNGVKMIEGRYARSWLSWPIETWTYRDRDGSIITRGKYRAYTGSRWLPFYLPMALRTDPFDGSFLTASTNHDGQKVFHISKHKSGDLIEVKTI